MNAIVSCIATLAFMYLVVHIKCSQNIRKQVQLQIISCEMGSDEFFHINFRHCALCILFNRLHTQDSLFSQQFMWSQAHLTRYVHCTGGKFNRFGNAVYLLTVKLASRYVLMDRLEITAFILLHVECK